ncbi:tRNA:m(4)X modification enzyme TRM13 [Linnemannia zychae]|nr:tRNA:m(4)X modification enzyme TRM13 [Linnemannia zychae]
MSDTKRPHEATQAAVAQALAGTLEPPVLNQRTRTKRQKVQAPPPPVPNRPRQCHYFAPGKNKYCSLTTKLGNKYCGEHSMFDPAASKNNTAGDGEETPRKRIPCPFDPSHTAWEDDLKAHLFKCNARPKDNADYYSLDINLTLPAPARQPIGFEITESSTTSKSEVLAALSQEQLKALIKKIQDLYAKYVPEIRTLILDHSALDERKKTVKNIKHAHQQASLLGHMKRLNMLDDPTSCYVEFGAGRGELSNYLKIAVDDQGTAAFVLVDRTPPRNKFDSAILGLKEIKSLVKRHTIDIKDLELAKVPEVRRDVTATQREIPTKALSTENKDTLEGERAAEGKEVRAEDPEYVEKKPVVAISKHLCGGATDITLKCLTNYQKSEAEHSNLSSPVKGILIALCCHQLCHYYMYPNQEYLKEIGITPEEFVYLTRMSSWAVCVNQTKTDSADDSKEKESGGGDDEHAITADKELDQLGSNIALDFQAREMLGRQCKRLLDVGRMRYLNENGFDAELVYYVDKETSLENLALMAVPVKASPL